jgi:hypothetical protein
VKLFLFRENIREPQEIEVDEHATPSDVLATYKVLYPSENPEEYQLFIENDDHSQEKKDSVKEGKFHPKDRVHCHRCQHIDVELVYNGKSHQVAFDPAATGAKILAQVPKIFKEISPRDAANLQLEISAGIYLEKNDHLGSFVAYPHCHLRIQLVPKVNVQG